MTFLDPGWSHDFRGRRPIADAALQEFTRETGIRVTHLPTPETPQGQLELIRGLLEKGAVTPDVYGVDVIWPPILRDYFIDLKPYFASKLSNQDPAVLANYLIRGKLVAMPYHNEIGILFYRTDLLREYGYAAPPRTWDELEQMALRIQKGERAKGNKDFWGFVWGGAASEILMSNAIEWQFSQGGGRIVESDKKVSVNNPNAIRAWERARHWIGWISPPSIASYEDWDSADAFWILGKAAFFRNWTSYYYLSHPVNLPFRDKAGVTSLPAGKSARVGTLGGLGLAISRSSAHREEALKLIEFLVAREAELESLP